MNAILIPLAVAGVVTVIRWALAQYRAYSGVQHPLSWYMRPK